MIESFEVLLEVFRPGSTAAQGVHLRAGQDVQHVELQRRQGGAEAPELLRGLVELPALVVGADDEHAKVEALGRLDGGPVEVVDEMAIPLQFQKLIPPHYEVDKAQILDYVKRTSLQISGVKIVTDRRRLVVR